MVWKKLIIYWLPTLFWCTLIFILSSKPTTQASYFDLIDFIIKKSAHIFIYAMLYFLVFRAVNEVKIEFINKRIKIKYTSGSSFFIPFLFCLLYAISDEYHQSFIPGRTARIRDIGFDFIGMFIAYKYVLKNKFII